MSVRQIKLADHSVSCDFCGRNLLRGEIGEPLFQAGEKRLSCELCRMRALRSGWNRERVADVPMPRPPGSDRGRLLDRLRVRTPQTQRRSTPTAPSRVKAEPRGTAGREKAAVDHFNSSPHRKTIASVGQSLGTPTVSVYDSGDSGVVIVAAWDLCWYRWRVEMAQGGVTVVEDGKGFELTELTPEEISGGVIAGSDGILTRPS